MDPDATLDRIVTALEDHDYTEAEEAIGDLVTWLQRGGFAPHVQSHTLEFLLGEMSDMIRKLAVARY